MNSPFAKQFLWSNLLTKNRFVLCSHLTANIEEYKMIFKSKTWCFGGDS